MREQASRSQTDVVGKHKKILQNPYKTGTIIRAEVPHTPGRNPCAASRRRDRFQDDSRWCSMMQALLMLWGGLTLVLIVLLIYRGTLTMHEDDQLFLDSAEAHMEKEQQELINRMDRLTPWVRILGTCSVVLIVLIGGIFFYTNLTR